MNLRSIPRLLCLALLTGPALGADNPAGVSPDARSITDPAIGGFADEMHGGAHYGAAGSAVTIMGMSFVTVTVSATGGATATISPAGAVPEIAGLPADSYILDAPGAGAGGAAVHGTVTASDPATGSITCGGCAWVNGRAAVTMTIYPSDAENGGPNGVSKDGKVYEPVTTATLADVSGKPYGTRLVLKNVRFGHGYGTQIGQGLRVCIIAATEWCGTGLKAPNDDGRTIDIAGPLGQPYLPRNLNDQPAFVYFGPFLFRRDDATACAGAARYAVIPFAGAGTNPNTAVINDAVIRIASRFSPWQIGLAAKVPATAPFAGTGGTDADLREGCDDWPAAIRAANLFYHSIKVGGPPQAERTAPELSIPSNALFATVTNATDLTPLYGMILCGEGTVYFPENGYTLYHGAGSCRQTRRVMTIPGASEISPDSFRHLASLPPGSTATLVTFGNSPFGPNANGSGNLVSRHGLACRAFQNAWPLLHWRCVDRSGGGARMTSLVPDGFSNGRPIGSTAPDWYDWTKPWLFYARDTDRADVILIGFDDQERTSMCFGCLLRIFQETQSASWARAAGRNPDFGVMPFPWQPTAPEAQLGTEFAASIQRSWVRVCADRTAAGGCPFIIDLARMGNIVFDGFDILDMPMRRGDGVIAPAAVRAASPSVYWPNGAAGPLVPVPQPKIGADGVVAMRYATPTPSAGALFDAFGGEIDVTLSANVVSSIGAGDAKSIRTTAPAAAGQAIVTVGPDLVHAIRTGDVVSGPPGLPANDSVIAVDISASQVTLAANLTGAGLGSGNTLIFTAPAPAQKYPGGILRVYKDGGTGNLAYRYDTVYFATTGSDCSGRSGSGTITCATHEVGYWHQGLNIAVPGGGTSACPDGSRQTCFLGIIDAVTFNSDGTQTIGFLSGTLSGSPDHVRPIIYRTPIPYTVSARPAETSYAATRKAPFSPCRIDPGARVWAAFGYGYRGERATLTWCDLVYPGPSLFFDQAIERFDAPMAVAIDGPKHWTAPGLYWNELALGPGFASSGTVARAGSFYEMHPDEPTAAALARIAGDAYGYCGSSAYGDTLVGPPWGSTSCKAHHGQLGLELIDGAVWNNLRLR